MFSRNFVLFLIYYIFGQQILFCSVLFRIRMTWSDSIINYIALHVILHHMFDENHMHLFLFMMKDFKIEIIVITHYLSCSLLATITCSIARYSVSASGAKWQVILKGTVQQICISSLSYLSIFHAPPSSIVRIRSIFLFKVFTEFASETTTDRQH